MKGRRGRLSRMAEAQANEVDVDKLLAEPHEKKRWLDTVIRGLEAALNSPHHQLIEQTGQIFDHFNWDHPKVDLRHRQQKLLADLARQVGGCRNRRRHEEPAHAA